MIVAVAVLAALLLIVIGGVVVVKILNNHLESSRADALEEREEKAFERKLEREERMAIIQRDADERLAERQDAVDKRLLEKEERLAERIAATAEESARVLLAEKGGEVRLAHPTDSGQWAKVPGSKSGDLVYTGGTGKPVPISGRVMLPTGGKKVELKMLRSIGGLSAPLNHKFVVVVGAAS